jgi:hypothetical protein
MGFLYKPVSTHRLFLLAVLRAHRYHLVVWSLHFVRQSISFTFRQSNHLIQLK